MSLDFAERKFCDTFGRRIGVHLWNNRIKHNNDEKNMKHSIKLLRYIFAACVIMISSCDPEVTQQSFVVQNDGNTAIAVWMRPMMYATEFKENGKDYMDQPDPNTLYVNSVDHFIPAHSTRHVLRAPSQHYWSEYMEEGDTILFYVLDAEKVENAAKKKEESVRTAILQAYFFSLDDLNSLDFKLSYPPKSNMQYIKMLPTYEDAIAGKTLQDIDLEQESLE